MFGIAPKKDLPDITDLINKGYSYQQIIDELRKRGYDDDTIKEVLIKNAAALKFTQAAQTQMPPASQPQEIPPQQSGQKPDIQEIQAILEQIIEEKWKNAYKDIDAIQDRIKSLAATTDNLTYRIDQISKRVDDLQTTLIGKNEEYNKAIKDVNIELQAFEKVLDKLIPAISDSVREMRDLVEELKSAVKKPGV
jgi:uncharacterized protein YukE